MTTACLFTVLAWGAPANPAMSVVASGSLPVVLNTSLPFRLRRSRDELREAYKTALRHSSKLARPDPLVVTPELVALYVELSDPKSLAPTERSRKRRALKGRLEKMRDKLKIDNIRRKAELRRQTRAGNRARKRAASRSRRGNRGGEPASAQGPGTIARANSLIALIQNTISPESWDVNGGLGSIRFYAPLNVLVIRATGEVHHQIGGTLPNLKR